MMESVEQNTTQEIAAMDGASSAKFATLRKKGIAEPGNAGAK